MGQLDGPAMEALSQQLGIDQQQTQTAVSAALPMILGAMGRQASNEQGAQQLAQTMDAHGTGFVDNLVGFLGSQDNGPGADIIGSLFGQRQPQLQQGIGQATGLDSGVVGKLLENLGPVVMSFLAQQRGQGGQGGMDIGGIAGMILGGGGQAAGMQAGQPQGGGLMDMVGRFLDQDNDGSAIDDVMGMVGRFMQPRQ
jgi:hypothetical protein